MKRLLHCLFFFTVIVFSVNAQQSILNPQKQWAFYHGGGLDFTTDPPTPVERNVFTDYGTASIADENGAMLFYSQGNVVLDKNNDTMPNGVLFDGYYNSQTPIITSFPGDKSKYYIFFVRSGNTPQFGIYYCVVDIKLNNGLGDVVGTPTLIADNLNTNIQNSAVAIQGDSCNIWLLTSSQGNANTQHGIQAFNINADGVEKVAVESEGNFYSTFGGMLVASPQKTKIAWTHCTTQGTQGVMLVHSRIFIADFDPKSGGVSNIEQLTGAWIKPMQAGRFLGIAFSPDGSKLYSRCWDSLYQWDLSLSTLAEMTASQKSVMTMNYNANSDLKLGPDGKIYVTSSDNVGQLSVINKPNLKGAASDAALNAVTLFPGTSGLLLNNPSLILEPITDTLHALYADTLVCKNEGSWSLNASEGYDNYVWSTDDTGRIQTINETGVYWVRYNDQCYVYFDTFRVDYLLVEPIINVNENVLSTTEPYVAYQWLMDNTIIEGATAATYKPTQNADYRVIVTSEEGCMDTSDIYRINNLTSIDNAAINALKVYPNPTKDVININAPFEVKASLTGVDGRQVLQSEKTSRLTVSHLTDGVYLLRITDLSGVLLKVEKIVVSNN